MPERDALPAENTSPHDMLDWSKKKEFREQFKTQAARSYLVLSFGWA